VVATDCSFPVILYRRRQQYSRGGFLMGVEDLIEVDYGLGFWISLFRLEANRFPVRFQILNGLL
jgi:hypothetical protein